MNELLNNSFDFDSASMIKRSIYKQTTIRKEVDLNSSFYFMFDTKNMEKPCKHTLLHKYIENLLSWAYAETFDNLCCDEIIELIKFELDIYEINYKKEFDTIDGEINYLKNKLEESYLVIAHHIFNILFVDRKFLLDFNTIVSNYVRSLKKHEYPNLLRKDGVIKRFTNLQGTKWLLNALIFRDKSRCQICGKDLSATREPQTGKIHIDHIIPLELGGTNDPTNMQILCDSCNFNKSFTEIKTSSYYTYFWNL